MPATDHYATGFVDVESFEWLHADALCKITVVVPEEFLQEAGYRFARPLQLHGVQCVAQHVMVVLFIDFGKKRLSALEILVLRGEPRERERQGHAFGRVAARCEESLGKGELVFRALGQQPQLLSPSSSRLNFFARLTERSSRETTENRIERPTQQDA